MSSIEATIDLLERLDKNPNDDNFLEALRLLVNLDYKTTVYLTLTQYILNSNHLNYADLLGFFKTLTQAKIQRHFNISGLLDVLDKLNLRASLKVSYLAGIMMALDSSRDDEIDDIQDILICEIEDSLLYEIDSLLDDSYIKTLVMILPQIRTNKLKLMDINLLRNFFVKVLIESFKLDNHNDNIQLQTKEIKKRPLYTSIPSISRILSRFCTLWSHQHTSNLENLLEGLLQISIQHERLLFSFSFSEFGEDSNTHSHLMTLLFTSLVILQSILTHAATSYGFKNSDPYLPTKIFEITSHLVLINHLVNDDEDLREWIAVNLLCVDMINMIEDDNIAATASEEILTTLAEEYPNKQQNNVKDIHFLHIAELLVLKCSPAFVLSTVLPICDRYLEDSKDVQAFENAHSVTLAFFGGVKPNDIDQVLVARVMSYAITLLKTLDVLSKEQFTTAYQSVIKKVSMHSVELTQWCLDGLCDAFKNVEIQESKVKVALTVPTLLPYIEYESLDDFLGLLERLHLNPWIEQEQNNFLALTFKSIKLVKNEKCLIKCLDWWGEYTSRCRSQPLIKARL